MGRTTNVSLLVIIFAITCSLYILSTFTSSAYSQGSNETVYLTDSKPFDVPYQDWVARWWKNWTSLVP